MFELTEEERYSPLWKKLSLYFQKEIENARKANDVLQPENVTNQIRGRIQAYKATLALGGSTPPPVE